ncbi:hypothetical protein [Pelagicoccus sp. SDUM812002]|uniref:hypothetical protein n=1 Tax=Pelagicoccus sp. SDUM812002 TaxID=3041266 RepID=UPI002812088B|nr:hypothetical protein [Pelagicoccus sp. SDUM812002]
MEAWGKSEQNAAQEPKASDWKIVVETRLQTKHLCKNPRLSRRLNMGATAGVICYRSELKLIS